mmetsp:Transcript_33926/g.99734  ORF Transcript_33926/g.99734 Transcript_33926/m.99734 type:complete len:212 (-) Transcript_33926:1263-1898(-)
MARPCCGSAGASAGVDAAHELGERVADRALSPGCGHVLGRRLLVDLRRQRADDRGERSEAQQEATGVVRVGALELDEVAKARAEGALEGGARDGEGAAVLDGAHGRVAVLVDEQRALSKVGARPEARDDDLDAVVGAQHLDLALGEDVEAVGDVALLKDALARLEVRLGHRVAQQRDLLVGQVDKKRHLADRLERLLAHARLRLGQVGHVA